MIRSSRAVGFGGVEEIHAEINGFAQESDHFGAGPGISRDFP